MRSRKCSVLTVAILICNFAVIICGVFFIPQVPWEFTKGAVRMGTVTAICVILFIVAVRKKELEGPAKPWLAISYGLVALVIFRWIITVVIENFIS